MSPNPAWMVTMSRVIWTNSSFEIPDDDSGLWIVAWCEDHTPWDSKQPQTDIRDYWHCVHGYEEAVTQLAEIQQREKYYTGGVYVCIASDCYPTLDTTTEQLMQKEKYEKEYF